MTAIPDHAEIYRKLHANRWDHVEQARRAREYQSKIGFINKILANAYMERDDYKLSAWELYNDNARLRKIISDRSRT